MAKKPKPKCEHGNSPIYVQGCPTCATTALQGLKLCRDNGWTFEELWWLLHQAFPTKESLEAAIDEARLTIKMNRALEEARNG